LKYGHELNGPNFIATSIAAWAAAGGHRLYHVASAHRQRRGRDDLACPASSSGLESGQWGTDSRHISISLGLALEAGDIARTSIATVGNGTTIKTGLNNKVTKKQRKGKI
jgi:hypothetical protein